MSEHVFVGFGFGPIQSGLFVKEAFESGNFSRIVVAEIDQGLIDAVRNNNGSYYVNVAGKESIEVSKIDNVELLNPTVAEDRKIIAQVLAEATEIVTSLPSVDFYDAGGDSSVASLIAEGLKKNSAAATLIYTAENNNHAAEIFGSFLALVRQAGFSGLAVFLDEAEAITSLAQSRRRDEANQNLRKLLDNADSHKGYMIVFATTPAFLNDTKRGAQSYPALWDRIRTVIQVPKGLRPNKRNLIIELEPPGKAELQGAGQTILKLHAHAYSWLASDVFTKNHLKKLIAKYMNVESAKVYRAFLRALIGILDTLEQSPGEAHVDSLIDSISFDTESQGS